jgi:predicted nuclease of predicted toxin-antitoxin system
MIKTIVTGGHEDPRDFQDDTEMCRMCDMNRKYDDTDVCEECIDELDEMSNYSYCCSASIDSDMLEQEIAQQEKNINQLNNNNMSTTKTKTMAEKLKKTEIKVETKKEALRRLYIANGLSEEDIYKDTRGFVIITRTGIDKIVSNNNIQVAYEVITLDRDFVVLKAVATMKDSKGVVRNMMSFGEANAGSVNPNLMGGGKKFPVAMAEKRAMSRVVLKITGFYEQGVFGQDEIVD